MKLTEKKTQKTPKNIPTLKQSEKIHIKCQIKIEKKL